MAKDDDLFRWQDSHVSLPPDEPGDLYSRVHRVLTYDTNPDTATDAVLKIFKAWLKAAEHDCRQPDYLYYERLAGRL